MRTLDFDKLAEALRLWTRINPITSQDDRKRDKHPRDQLYNTRQKNGSRTPSCVYCDTTEHRSFAHPDVVSVAERWSILLQKRLCFNCTGPHKVDYCRSKITCGKCKKKNHTSICDSNQRSEGTLTALQSDQTGVVYH